MRGRRLKRDFYVRDTVLVARELCGMYLVRELDGERRVGRIIETEAYTGHDDQASHARRGPTPRAAIMFGRPGVAYVYQIYGVSFCLNLVTMPAGFPAAVLVRAIEPVSGIPEGVRTDGPGRLCKALSIDRAQNGHDLTRSPLWVEDRNDVRPTLVATPRVNVDYAGDWALREWRFAVVGTRYSQPRWTGPRRP